jgi:hypothetical protein
MLKHVHTRTGFCRDGNASAVGGADGRYPDGDPQPDRGWMFEMVRDFGATRNPDSAIDMITIFTPAVSSISATYLDWRFNSKALGYGRNFMY